MTTIEFKTKEKKDITFTIKDSNETVIDVSSATFTFEAKKKKSDTTKVIEKADGDFDKTNAASGIVKITLDATDTNLTGDYIGEVKIVLATGDIDKSQDFNLIFKEAVTN